MTAGERFADDGRRGQIRFYMLLIFRMPVLRWVCMSFFSLRSPIGDIEVPYVPLFVALVC